MGLGWASFSYSVAIPWKWARALFKDVGLFRLNDLTWTCSHELSHFAEHLIPACGT